MTVKLGKTMKAAALAGAVVLSSLALGTSEASALPRQPAEGEAAICYYDGKSYSEGAIIIVNGRRMKCDYDGKWHDDGTAGRKGFTKPIPRAFLGR